MGLETPYLPLICLCMCVCPWPLGQGSDEAKAMVQTLGEAKVQHPGHPLWPVPDPGADGACTEVGPALAGVRHDEAPWHHPARGGHLQGGADGAQQVMSYPPENGWNWSDIWTECVATGYHWVHQEWLGLKRWRQLRVVLSVCIGAGWIPFGEETENYFDASPSKCTQLDWTDISNIVCIPKAADCDAYICYIILVILLISQLFSVSSKIFKFFQFCGFVSISHQVWVHDACSIVTEWLLLFFNVEQALFITVALFIKTVKNKTMYHS